MAQATSHAPATARPPRVCTLVPFIIIIINIINSTITVTMKGTKVHVQLLSYAYMHGAWLVAWAIIIMAMGAIIINTHAHR